VRGTGRDAHAVRDACTRCDALSIPIFTLLEEDAGPDAKLTALTRMMRRAAELRYARICEWMDAPTSDIAERIRRGDDIDLVGTRAHAMFRDAPRRP
jgi:hypothetical protein